MMYQKVAFFFALVIAGIKAQDGTPPPDPCTTETEAMEKCAQDNKCEASCPGTVFDDTSTQENPIPEVDPMTDTEAAKVAFQKWFDVECNIVKENICKARTCCPACSGALETAWSCMSSALPTMIEDLSAEMNSDIAEANNAAGTTPTVVPTLDVADFVSGWTCEVTANMCGGSASTSTWGASSVGYMLAVISAASLVAAL